MNIRQNKIYDIGLGVSKKEVKGEESSRRERAGESRWCSLDACTTSMGVCNVSKFKK